MSAEPLNDLLLWRLVHEQLSPNPPKPEPAQWLPLLEALTALSLRSRVVFFGAMPSLLSHEDPRMRSAALRALRGAQGLRALRAALAAFDDDDREVREEAVKTFREGLGPDPWCWVVAMFHHNAEVRRAALEQPPTNTTGELSLLLLSDSTLRETLLRRLPWRCAEGQTPIETGTLVLPALAGFVSSGLLSPGDGRAYLDRVSSPKIVQWLATERARQPGECNAFLATAAKEAPTAERYGDDVLDEVLSLYADAERRHAPLFDALLNSVWSVPAQRLRLFCSAMIARSRAGVDAPMLLRIAGAAHPRMLLFPWLTEEQRSEVAEGLSAAPSALTLVDAALADELLRGVTWKTSEGILNLRRIAAIAGRGPTPRLHHLLLRVSRAMLLEAMRADPAGGALVFSVMNTNDTQAMPLLNELATALGTASALAWAMFAAGAPEEKLTDLANAPSAQLLPLLDALEHGVDQGWWSISVSRAKRLAELVAARMAFAGISSFLSRWLIEREAPSASPLPALLLSVWGRETPQDRWLSLTRSVPERRLATFLESLSRTAALPWSLEVALAKEHVNHSDPRVRAWAQGVLPAASTLRPIEAEQAPVALSPLVANALLRCTEAQLKSSLEPCFVRERIGLAEALAARRFPRPSVDVCAALLGAIDPLTAIASQFARFESMDAAFVNELEASAVRWWNNRTPLSLLGHAWLYRWELHANQGMELLLASQQNDLLEALRWATTLPSTLLAKRVWSMVAARVGVWRFRDRSRIEQHLSAPLIELLTAELLGKFRDSAARILSSLVRSGVGAPLLEAARPAVLRTLADCDESVRDVLRWWVDSTGFPTTAPRIEVSGPSDEVLLARVRSSGEVEELERWCRSNELHVVQEATLRLIELGEEGVSRIADLLDGAPRPPQLKALIESVPLWAPGVALARARALTESAKLTAEERFLLCFALLERGEDTVLDAAARAAAEESEPGWLTAELFERLRKLYPDSIALACLLAPSPHPHAYEWATRTLMELSTPPKAAFDAMLRFLETGVGRLRVRRQAVAKWLQEWGDHAGQPVLSAALFEDAEPDFALKRALLPSAQVLSLGALWAGEAIAPEARLRSVLDLREDSKPEFLLDVEQRTDCYEELLRDTRSEQTRKAAAEAVSRGLTRALKLRRVAETFAWGVRMGRELTGRLFSVQMTTGTALGYTRLAENRIFVSALPILRRERAGQEVVEGLLLHELGHQVWHRTPEAISTWEQAQKEQLGGLLNLVADEHLERNLRALDQDFGDRLKRLAAYAFQHTARELPVQTLIETLQARTFEVLHKTKLGIARAPGNVLVDSGGLLLTMERAGMSFPRFMRSMRMGLGDRYGDPKVAKALALFRGNFRRSDMPTLLEIARELRRIFGGEARLVECLGTHETVGNDAAEQDIHGDGITDKEVQREVERITDVRELEKRKARDDSATTHPGGPPWLNAVPDERFDLITQIVPVQHDPALHRQYAAKVARHANAFRAYLEQLGVSYVSQRLRLRGRRFDTTRARAVVLRRDPRMLIARVPKVYTDLFIGIVIDCSGSMASRDHMERARLFGTLIAEAARELDGVDVRIFGFTDRVIYDAGDAVHPAAHALNAGGGNNDAGALWHAAQVAMRSRRRARLLVMISDGLPTECTVSALRGLVARLRARYGICCAQVAVQPLSEVCFPHYVVLQGDNQDAAVRRFGAIVAGLVRTTIKG